MSISILTGDCRAVLQTLQEKSVHCCVTSPPYFGLRDYGCEGQIGLEESPADFIEQMVLVFREVRRVLRDDGTVWLNLGDSYAGSGKGGNPENSPHKKQGSNRGSEDFVKSKRMERGSGRWGGGNARAIDGLKPKDLIGIPWRVALALQEDGWYLRQDIIWSKPNCMPESVGDRCTKSHEYIFLLSKSHSYFFDSAAIAEKATYYGIIGMDASGFKDAKNFGGKNAKGNRKTFRGGGVYTQNQTFDNSARISNASTGNTPNITGMRNKRSVWEVATSQFPQAHFATFPPELIEPCVKAGCPLGGTVLDPFGGAGTSGLVADRLGRNAILIELNPAYIELARNRITDDSPLFTEVA